MPDDPTATASDAEVLGRVAALLRRADLALLAVKEPPLREIGVSGSLYAVLMNLRVTPGLTGAELARVVGVTPQAIGPLVAKLVDRGWVERRAHPRHQNVQELHLTEAGRTETTVADRIMAHLEDHLRRSLGEDDYEQLATLLGRVIEHLPGWAPPRQG
ncbi:MarR family winged helix-turn-helix transcriptional regulator [Pseudonocardia zijingensis]|uniref:HTH marR-type domain-containing protein n=1 Tax=Pseudonocardia zijingensis TaxID=153376 RepID=A0ABP4B111_9PSEU